MMGFAPSSKGGRKGRMRCYFLAWSHRALGESLKQIDRDVVVGLGGGG